MYQFLLILKATSGFPSASFGTVKVIFPFFELAFSVLTIFHVHVFTQVIL